MSDTRTGRAPRVTLRRRPGLAPEPVLPRPNNDALAAYRPHRCHYSCGYGTVDMGMTSMPSERASGCTLYGICGYTPR